MFKIFDLQQVAEVAGGLSPISQPPKILYRIMLPQCNPGEKTGEEQKGDMDR